MIGRYWNINLEEMLRAGVHFGHGTRKWISGIRGINDRRQVTTHHLITAGYDAPSYHHHHPPENGVGTSAQWDGFRCSWNATNLDEDQRRPQLKYCTDLFKGLLDDGRFLNRDDFLDNVITCPDHVSPPDLYTMVYCHYQSDCEKCLEDAASLMGRYCADCYGFRALSDECCVRYETYRFSSFD